MCYEVTFEMVNTDTGEILSGSRTKTITTEYEDVPSCFIDWVSSLYRGLRAGYPLSLNITCIKFEPPTQLDLF